MQKNENENPMSKERHHFINNAYMSEAVVMVDDKREDRRQQRRSPKPVIETRDEFLNKKRALSDIPFMPNENFGVGMMIVFIPYSMGLLFIFFYIFEASLDRMMKMSHEHSFILIWMIGYELISGLFILWVFKMLLFSLVSKPK